MEYSLEKHKNIFGSTRVGESMRMDTGGNSDAEACSEKDSLFKQCDRSWLDIFDEDSDYW